MNAKHKKNILYGYLYMLGGLFFVLLMAWLIYAGNEDPNNRNLVEMALVTLLGISCIYIGFKQVKDNKIMLGGVPKMDMEDMISSMERFKSLDITVREIADHIDPSKEEYIKCNPVIIYANDVTEVLDKYRTGKITEKDMMVWCNMITFSKCYHFNPDREDELESVVSEIHKKLDRGGKLSEKEIDEYIMALINETEI